MQVNKLFSPAIFHREGEGFWVTFPDFPECFTEGDNMELAYVMIAGVVISIPQKKKYCFTE